MAEFTETLYDAYAQQLAIDEVLYEQRTEHQHLLIFRNAKFGRVMALDGIVQTTEADEFIYHEMLTHVPILAHGRVREVLIVGGGDGAMLREVLRHRHIRRATLVEIDRQVIDVAKRWLSGHSAGAFDDPRVRIVIDDGARFVASGGADFDVIICDSTDPIGPGESLFSAEFYRHCAARLAPGGILVTQNGVPFMQLDEVRRTAQRLRGVFSDSGFYSAAVPTYVGGIMTFAWASQDPLLRQVPLSTLRQRFEAGKLQTRCYTPELHVAAFALPRYVLDAIAEATP
jgi:spermidine synthase